MGCVGLGRSEGLGIECLEDIEGDWMEELRFGIWQRAFDTGFMVRISKGIREDSSICVYDRCRIRD